MRDSRGPVHSVPGAMRRGLQQHDDRLKAIENNKTMTTIRASINDMIDPVEGEHIIDTDDQQHAWYLDGEWHKASDQQVPVPALCVPTYHDHGGYLTDTAGPRRQYLKLPGGIVGVRAGGYALRGTQPHRQDSVTAYPVYDTQSGPDNVTVSFTAQDVGLRTETYYYILAGFRCPDGGGAISMKCTFTGDTFQNLRPSYPELAAANNFGYDMFEYGLPHGAKEYGISGPDDQFDFYVSGNTYLDWILFLPDTYPNGNADGWYFHADQFLEAHSNGYTEIYPAENVSSPRDDSANAIDMILGGENNFTFATDPGMYMGDIGLGYDEFVGDYVNASYSIVVTARTWVSDEHDYQGPTAFDPNGYWGTPGAIGIWKGNAPHAVATVPGHGAWCPIWMGLYHPGQDYLQIASWMPTEEFTYAWGIRPQTLQTRMQRYMYIPYREIPT